MLRELLKKNRSIRSFDPSVKITNEELLDMIDCTRLCPSSANLQSMKFCPVTDEEKVKKVYNGYSSWQPLKPLLSEWFGDDISALANAANSWRNELAHGKREYQPTVDVITAIRLIEHINYCIVFRLAGYSDEQIKAIIEEILVR